MKQIRLFLIGLVLIFAGTAHAADILKVQDVEVAIGESVVLSIELENETMNLMGWQCDIVLPEGLSLALKNNGKPAAMLGSRFATTEHSITSSRLANGAYRFVATSMDGDAIPGNSGTLFTVTLQADAALSSGTTQTGTITNIEFNTKDNQKLTLNDLAFAVRIPGNEGTQCATPTIVYDKGELVLECTTEDAECHVNISVADGGEQTGKRITLTPIYIISAWATAESYIDSDRVTAIIRWRDGQPVFEGFSNVTIDKAQAADVNGDGQVGIGDIVAITNIMAGVE